MEAYRGQYKNPARWTDKYTALTAIQNQRNDWATLMAKYQKYHMKYCITASLKVENRTQYRILQMNNTVINQIYPKKSEYLLLDMTVRNDDLTVTKIRLGTIIQYEKQKDMQNN